VLQPHLRLLGWRCGGAGRGHVQNIDA
jgi:hypothetical protein